MIGDDYPQPVPDLVEPIRAVRVWRSISVPAQSSKAFTALRSMAFGVVWPTGLLTAECLTKRCSSFEACTDPPCPPRNRGHGQPCGIYAFTDLEWAARQYQIGAPDKLIVVGEVLLGGRVWPSTRGYRAQHARVAAIYTWPDDERVLYGGVPAFLGRVAERYNVPLVTGPGTLAQWAETHRRHRDPAPTLPAISTAAPGPAPSPTPIRFPPLPAWIVTLMKSWPHG